ncbi:MAG: hypothetical protein ABI858_01890 [Pseudoxanthomonas sp.]
MQSQIQPSADYDWLLEWTDWSVLDNQRLEAVFALEMFLQRSKAKQATWLLDFLSWKCERLISDGCWYEAELDNASSASSVRIVKDTIISTP